MLPQYLVLGFRYFAFNKANVQLMLGLRAHPERFGSSRSCARPPFVSQISNNQFSNAGSSHWRCFRGTLVLRRGRPNSLNRRRSWAVLGRARGAGELLARNGSCSVARMGSCSVARPIHLVEVLLQGAYDSEARLGRADRLPGVAPRRSDEGHCRGGPSFQPCPGGKQTWRVSFY